MLPFFSFLILFCIFLHFRFIERALKGKTILHGKLRKFTKMRINCFGDKVSSLHCKIVLLDEQQLVHEVLVSLSLWYHFISVGASPLDARRLPVAALRIRFGLAYLLWHGHERVRSSFTSSPRPIVPLFSLFFHMVVVPRVLTIPVVCYRPNRSEQRHLPSFVRVSSPFLKTKTSRLTSLLSLSRLAIHMDRASRFGSWFASDK